MTEANKRIVVVEVTPEKVHAHRPAAVRQTMARASMMMAAGLLLMIISATALAAFSASGARDFLGPMVVFATLGLLASVVLGLATALLHKEARLIHREEEIVKEILQAAGESKGTTTQIMVAEQVPISRPKKPAPTRVLVVEEAGPDLYPILEEIELLAEERALLGREKRQLAEERRLLAHLAADEQQIRRRVMDGFKKR